MKVLCTRLASAQGGKNYLLGTSYRLVGADILFLPQQMCTVPVKAWLTSIVIFFFVYDTSVLNVSSPNVKVFGIESIIKPEGCLPSNVL